MRKPKPPELLGATWSGTQKDGDGPIVEFRGPYEVRSNAPRPVKQGYLNNLYHATPYYREIVDSDQVLPAGITRKTTLGGSTRYSSISFSGSLEAGAYIAVCIAEAIQIAKGKVSLQNILERAKILGISEFTKDYGGFLQYWSIKQFTKAINDNELQDIFKQACNGIKINKYTGVAEGMLSDDEKVDYVWNAYKAMLHSGCFSKKIPDPLFMVAIKSFESLKINNVGVVRAKLEPATWICNSRNDQDLEGAFTYIGHNRDICMPDADEYRVFDYKNLSLRDYYNLLDCIDILEQANDFWKGIISSSFLKPTKSRRRN